MAFARCVLANWTVREPPNCRPCRTNHKSSFSNQPGQPARPGQPACLSMSKVSTGVQKHEMVPNCLQMLVFIRLWEAALKHEMFEPAGQHPRAGSGGLRRLPAASGGFHWSRPQDPKTSPATARRPSAGHGQYPATWPQAGPVHKACPNLRPAPLQGPVRLDL